jgi:serine/threonine protein phosphatase 1
MFGADATPPIIIPPLTGRLFAIGDIHGCLAELEVLLHYLRHDAALGIEDQVIFLGDYIDRGPHSAGVIDALIDFQSLYPKTIFLRGNHEQFLHAAAGFSAAPHEGAQLSWLKSGGQETLSSYGIGPEGVATIGTLLPEAHRSFYKSLSRYAIGDSFVCVHAGLDPHEHLLVQPDDVIYWIRDPFLHHPHSFQKLVIFGHTPQKEVLFESPYRLGIDTGLVYGNKLTMIELSQKRVFQVAASSKSVISSMLGS